MNNQDYHSSIVVHNTPEEVFGKISCVAEWWAKNFEGKSQEADDVFTVRFRNGDMYKTRIAEVVPGSKIVWEFIDTYQRWVKNSAEWVGTKIIWEISPHKDGAEVKMTHQGLVAELECFDQCTKAWNYLTQESLFKLLDEGKGLPV